MNCFYVKIRGRNEVNLTVTDNLDNRKISMSHV